MAYPKLSCALNWASCGSLSSPEVLPAQVIVQWPEVRGSRAERCHLIPPPTEGKRDVGAPALADKALWKTERQAMLATCKLSTPSGPLAAKEGVCTRRLGLLLVAPSCTQSPPWRKSRNWPPKRMLVPPRSCSSRGSWTSPTSRGSSSFCQDPWLWPSSLPGPKGQRHGATPLAQKCPLGSLWHCLGCQPYRFVLERHQPPGDDSEQP